MADNAIFKFDEIAKIEAFWWVGGPGAPGVIDGDWMAMIYRALKAEEWSLTYRFRYYRDDQIFHTKDEKAVYQARFPRDKVSEAIAAVDELAEKMLSQFGGKIYRKRFVDGNRRKFEHWIKAQPFTHRMTPEEYHRRRPQ